MLNPGGGGGNEGLMANWWAKCCECDDSGAGHRCGTNEAIFLFETFLFETSIRLHGNTGPIADNQ